MLTATSEFEPNNISEEFANYNKVRTKTNSVFVSLLRYKLYQTTLQVKSALRFPK